MTSTISARQSRARRGDLSPATGTVSAATPENATDCPHCEHRPSSTCQCPCHEPGFEPTRDEWPDTSRDGLAEVCNRGRA